MITIIHTETDFCKHKKLKGYLADEDIQLLHALNGADALDKILLFKRQLLVSEFFLGRNTALKLLTKIKALNISIPVIILTEEELSDHEVTSLFALGVHAVYNWKEIPELIESINIILGTRLPIPKAGDTSDETKEAG